MSVDRATALTTGHEQVAGLPPISLSDLNDAAVLQERVDRKYILTGPQLADLIERLAHRLAVLEIDGRRSFGYESTYFDTVELRSFHAAAFKRRHRYKVRTRTYLDSETTMLEVKTRGPRKMTVKRRQPHEFEHRTALDRDAEWFIDSMLASPGLARTLSRTLTTGYQRTTLVDLDDVARVTIDADLRFADWNDRASGLIDRFVLETKSTGSPSVTDRVLWSTGIRPDKISKYATGLAALHPELPSNKWHRTLQRHFV
jgi:hypothetical protein